MLLHCSIRARSATCGRGISIPLLSKLEKLMYELSRLPGLLSHLAPVPWAGILHPITPIRTTPPLVFEGALSGHLTLDGSHG